MMDKSMSKAERRQAAREYYDTHGTEEFTEELTLDVKKPIMHIISVRLDGEHMDKLAGLAKEKGLGVTTVARILLQRGLDTPPALWGLDPVNQEFIEETRRRLIEAHDALANAKSLTPDVGTARHPKRKVYQRSKVKDV